MRKFTISVLIFGLICYTTFSIFDRIVTIGLRNSNAFIYENLNKTYKGEINSNIIINGSSKALVQISPQIIDSLTGLNSYNFGMNGANFELQNLVYNLYRKYNNKPDYIIHVVSSETLELNENLHEYKRFAPYLNDTLVEQFAKKHNGFSSADYYFPFIRYSGFLIEIINGFSNYFNYKLPLENNSKSKGYIAYNKKWDSSFDNFKKTYANGKYIKIDSAQISLFDNYIEYCVNDRIEIILIYPPTYYESHSYIRNRNEIISLYDSIADKHQIQFLNYSENELSLSKKYFYNSQHLNKNGAELFTKMICADIMKESKHKRIMD